MEKGRGIAATAWITGAALFVLGCVVYWPSLDDYFLSDDLTELNFLRTYRGSWWAFLDPSKMYSDLVTHSRYRPVYVYYKWVLDAVFHDHVVGYHVLSMALHALTGVAVLLIAWRLFSERLLAIAAAVLFVVWRLQTQMVIWAACNYRIVSVGLVLWGFVALYGRRRWVGVACCTVTLLLGIGMNPELVVSPAIMACFAVYYRIGREKDQELARRFALGTAGHGLVTVAFVIATKISAAIYYVRPVSMTPDPQRVIHFLASLFVPFTLPLVVKLAIVALIVVAVLYARDARWLLLLAIVCGCALTWGFFRAYPLTPRYFYFASSFGSILVAALLLRGAQWIAKVARIEPRTQLVTWCLLAVLVAVNVRGIRSLDVVHFEYLSVLGERLAEVQHEARQRGQPVRVLVGPDWNLAEGDLAYFQPDLEYVTTPDPTARVIGTDLERYQRILGVWNTDDYWFMPWFTP